MTDELRGFALGQLSASAIAHGAKQIETRSWAVPEKFIGQRVAILASKTLPRGGMTGLRRWMLEEQNIPWLVDAGYVTMDDELQWAADAEALPRGAFICTATILECMPTEDLVGEIGDLEWSHGDYTPGRYGWLFDEVYRLAEPVPWWGSLGIFKIQEHTVSRILKQEVSIPVPGVASERTPGRSGLEARTF